MLFLLKKEGGKGASYYLLSGNKYSVGRKGADILIENDLSISRKHAIIKVNNDSITVTDLKSKYHTFHHNNQMEANVEVTVSSKDVIKFGVFQSSYRIERVDLVTTGSGLNTVQKKELKENIEAVEGKVVNNWTPQCTHLTVQEIVLTIKVLHAIIDDRPIVNLKYWRRFVESVRDKQPAPSKEDFKPPMAEALLSKVSITPNPKRITLFAEKIFVFPNEKVKLRMNDIIEKTGGSCLSWDVNPLTLLEVFNSIDKYIFVHADDVKEMPDSLKEIHQHLRKMGQRLIPVQEIAMAILLCSCEKDCNPSFNRVEQVFINQGQKLFSQEYALALETQSQQPAEDSKKDVVIPGTFEGDLDTLYPSKQKVEITDDKLADPLPSTSQIKEVSAACNSENGVFKRPNEADSGNRAKRAKLANNIEGAQENNRTIRIEATVKKRKADENLEPSGSKKQLLENPFASFRSRNKTNSRSAPAQNNPFAALRIKTETSSAENIDETNPFKHHKQNDAIETEERQRSVSSLNNTFEPSQSQNNRVNHSTTSNTSKWLSKGSTNVPSIKVEDDLKVIFDKFKNTVVIEVTPMTLRRLVIDGVDGTVNESRTGKNFKKFEKVAPLKPQLSIVITRFERCSNATFSETSNSTVNRNVEDEEEEEELMPRPTVARKKSKANRFNL